MATKNIGKQPIYVRLFKNGSQGQHDLKEIAERVVYQTSAIYPMPMLCAATPLTRRTYSFVEYEGAHWQVIWEEESSATLYWSGRPAGFRLYLPSDYRELICQQKTARAS